MLFDRHAARYRAAVNEALRFSGAEVDRLAGHKARPMLALMTRRFGDPRTVKALDVGCGIGLVDRELVSGVGHLCGTDVSQKSLRQAASLVPEASFRHFYGHRIPYADKEFDFVFAVCVLHHIPLTERAGFVGEMARVTRPGGMAFILEHNPLNPVTRYIVSRCAFDVDAVLVGRSAAVRLLQRAGLRPGGSSYIGFWPKPSAFGGSLERGMGWRAIGAQHYAWGVRAARWW